MTTQACMGGWCAKRAQCPHYHAADTGRPPEERLCERGNDGVRVVDASAFRTIRVDIFGAELKRLEAAA